MQHILGPLSSILAVVFTGDALFFRVLWITYANGEGQSFLRTITPEIRVWK